MVRAKFRVTQVTKTESGEKVELAPVTGGSPENEKFFKWTPSGKIEMGIVNPEIKEFNPGDEFYVDFTKIT